MDTELTALKLLITKILEQELERDGAVRFYRGEFCERVSEGVAAVLKDQVQLPQGVGMLVEAGSLVVYDDGVRMFLKPGEFPPMHSQGYALTKMYAKAKQ